MTPALAGMAYDPTMRVFHYSGNGTLLSTLTILDDKLASAFPLLTLAIYIAILLLLIRRVSFSTDYDPLFECRTLIKRHRYGQGTSIMTIAELRVLIQSVVIFGLFATMFVFKKLIGSNSQAFIVGTTLLWQAACGVGPVLYLSMSARIRRCAWKMVMCRCVGEKNTTPVSRVVHAY